MRNRERVAVMPLAEKLRELREAKGMSLDELATKAEISKTYLWELERDTAGTKKPSAHVLLQIANALSTTLAELLALPTVMAQTEQVQLPPALVEFNKLMEAQGTKLPDKDLRDLAMMRFRGGQPRTAQEWMQVYLVFDQSSRKKKP